MPELNDAQKELAARVAAANRNPRLFPEQSDVTLRDLFAAFALAGLLARADDDGNDPAAVAFGYADKMLRIREAHS